DLDTAEIESVVEAAVAAGASGIVATNTTTSREGLPMEHAERPGGLSGAPLFERSREVIARVYRTVGDRVPIIGVGGVATAEQALAHMRAGASLVQLYTGFIYGGPLLVGQLLRGLSRSADAEGWTSVGEIVGTTATKC
ncbi:MAG: dihydroorotate dehydrogenase (quinone), partial [Deltaproteobacteria bacterium]|nr:dihydroorotate dehydrogenase (quinone) [Deltaproteobacteria bacterium]